MQSSALAVCRAYGNEDRFFPIPSFSPFPPNFRRLQRPVREMSSLKDAYELVSAAIQTALQSKLHSLFSRAVCSRSAMFDFWTRAQHKAALAALTAPVVPTKHCVEDEEGSPFATRFDESKVRPLLPFPESGGHQGKLKRSQLWVFGSGAQVGSSRIHTQLARVSTMHLQRCTC